MEGFINHGISLTSFPAKFFNEWLARGVKATTGTILAARLCNFCN